jgi:hypothetical protein
MEPALDCLHKLIAHGCLRIESGVAGESCAVAESGCGNATRRTHVTLQTMHPVPLDTELLRQEGGFESI